MFEKLLSKFKKDKKAPKGKKKAPAEAVAEEAADITAGDSNDVGAEPSDTSAAVAQYL